MNLKQVATGLCMGLMLSSSALAFSPSDFTDMPNNWSTDGLNHAIENGLLQGTNGKINASGNLSRAEMATIINRAFGADKEANISQYTDVSSSSWYYEQIGRAVQMGIMNGTSDTTASPSKNITRQEAFVVLARAFQMSTTYNETSLSSFTDADQVASWAKSAIGSMIDAGYIKGTDQKINPTGTITRAEFAVLMDRMVNQYITAGIDADKITGDNLMVNSNGKDISLSDLTVQGNLIIGDGVGDANVTLNNVTIKGRLIVRGGGSNCIYLTGNSNVPDITIGRQDGDVQVDAGNNKGTIGTVTMEQSPNTSIFKGTASTLKVDSTNLVKLNQATITTVNVQAENAQVTLGDSTTLKSLSVDKTAKASKISLESGATVSTLETAAEGTTVTAASGSKITSVKANGTGTAIEGNGSVTSVKAGANNVTVTTLNTSVTADSGVTGTKAGSISVLGGSTVTTTTTTNTSSSSSGSNTSSKTRNALESFVLHIGDSDVTFSASNNKVTVDLSEYDGKTTISYGKLNTSSDGIFTVDKGSTSVKLNTNTQITLSQLISSAGMSVNNPTLNLVRSYVALSKSSTSMNPGISFTSKSFTVTGTLNDSYSTQVTITVIVS